MQFFSRRLRQILLDSKISFLYRCNILFVIEFHIRNLHSFQQFQHFGIKTANITEKNGPLAGLTTVTGEEDILLITNKGVIIRFGVDTVSQTGRATQGVRLIRLEEDANVSTMAKVEPEDVEEVEGTEIPTTDLPETDTPTEVSEE